MAAIGKHAAILGVAAVVLVGCGFASIGQVGSDSPGFFLGIWHGLLAPWTLILRLFMDIHMYAHPNTGWLYDCGFLIGVVFSIPVGWVAAIVATIVHLV